MAMTEIQVQEGDGACYPPRLRQPMRIPTLRCSELSWRVHTTKDRKFFFDVCFTSEQRIPSAIFIPELIFVHAWREIELHLLEIQERPNYENHGNEQTRLITYLAKSGYHIGRGVRSNYLFDSILSVSR